MVGTAVVDFVVFDDFEDCAEVVLLCFEEVSVVDSGFFTVVVEVVDLTVVVVAVVLVVVVVVFVVLSLSDLSEK